MDRTVVAIDWFFADSSHALPADNIKHNNAQFTFNM